jgi:hypothetical protein
VAAAAAFLPWFLLMLLSLSLLEPIRAHPR